MGNPRRPLKQNEEEKLHAAARAGDLRSVESICNSNPLAVNFRDRHSRTPLHLAAWSGHAEVVSFLCKNKADVGAAAMDNTGAIHFASQKGHVEVVRILVSAGVSVKVANRKGLTPLHFAAQGSYLELIKYLIKKGAIVNAKSKSGQTPHDLGNSEEVRLYLEECQKSVEKGGELRSEKTKQDSKQVAEGNSVASDSKETGMGESDSRKKRKSEVAEENGLSKPKRDRVSLEHLLAEDNGEDVLE